MAMTSSSSSSLPSMSSSSCHSRSLAQPVLHVFCRLLAVWLSTMLKLSAALAAPLRLQREAAASRTSSELTAEELAVVLERIGIAGATGAGDCSRGIDVSSVFEQEEPTMEEAKAAFDVFDRNNDGFIDATELERMLAILGFFREGDAAAEVSDCRRMIEPHDADKDGRIDFAEFIKFLESSF